MTQDHFGTNEYYSTSDLSLAAALSLYFPVEAINRNDSRKANFLFKRSSELDELVENYWRGNLRVEPQSYFGQLRFIKSRLYEND